MRRAVLVLQALAGEGGAPAVPPTRKPRERESAAAQIQVADRWKPNIE